MVTDTEQIGRRLREALGGRTITWFQQRMVEEGVPGSGYSNVQRYVAGKKGSPPPLEWLMGAAGVLGVPVAWLAFEVGGRSEWEEAIANAKSGATMLSVWTVGASEVLVVELIRRLVDAQPTSAPEPTNEDLRGLVRSVERQIVNTWMALHGGSSNDAGGAAHFVLTALSTLIAGAPGARQGGSIRGVAQKLPREHVPDQEATDGQA